MEGEDVLVLHRLGVELVQEVGVCQVEVGQGHVGSRVKLAARNIEEAVREVEVRGVRWRVFHLVVAVIIIRL